MKDSSDKATADLFNEKRLGRPVTGNAKTDAQRMREYRLRRKEQGARVVLQRPEALDSFYNQPDDLFNEIQSENAYLRRERDLYKDQLRRYMQEAGDDFDTFFSGVTI
ncbi:MAG: hypothetical protein WAW41_14200 [Methylobacter sp.]